MKDGYYVMTPPGNKPSDFEGPFANSEQAIDQLREFANEFVSPEMQHMVIVVCKDHRMDLYRDSNGNIVRLQRFMWGK